MRVMYRMANQPPRTTPASEATAPTNPRMIPLTTRKIINTTIMISRTLMGCFYQDPVVSSRRMSPGGSRQLTGNRDKILGYFNNHFHGYAPENCLQIMQMLGSITPLRDVALSRVISVRKKRLKKVNLETWLGQSNDNSLKIIEFV